MLSKLNDWFIPNSRRMLLVDDRHTYFRILVLKMAEFLLDEKLARLLPSQRLKYL